MSLLGNLITQVARSALDNNSQQNSVNQNAQAGGLGGILGSVLGGGAQARQQNPLGNDGKFGMDDVLGGLLQSQMGNRGMGGMGNSGGLGSVLGSVLSSQLGGGNRGMAGGMGAGMGGGKGLLVAALMPLVLGWIQRNGGLSGALAKIQNMGLGNRAQSWVSAEAQNENLDPQEVNKLFDDNEIHEVAAKTGADENEVRQGIAELLPEVINQLTPNGDLNTEKEADNEIADILQQLKTAMGNR